MKKLSIFTGFFIAVTLFAFGLTGCDGGGTVTPLPAQVIIEEVEIADITATVKFIPNGYTASYSLAIGSAGDLAAFEAGTLAGIETITGRYEKIFGGLAPQTQYTIFAQGINSDNEKGDVYTLTVNTTKETWNLTFEGALGEYYGDFGWADNMDLTLHTGMQPNGSIVDGYKLFFEAFAPAAADPNDPLVIEGTYIPATSYMPDPFEFAPGEDDGTGNIRSSQYVKYVGGVASKTAIVGGSYTVTKSGTQYTVTVEVETTEDVIIKGVYTGEIEIDDWSWL